MFQNLKKKKKRKKKSSRPGSPERMDVTLSPVSWSVQCKRSSPKVFDFYIFLQLDSHDSRVLENFVVCPLLLYDAIDNTAQIFVYL